MIELVLSIALLGAGLVLAVLAKRWRSPVWAVLAVWFPAVILQAVPVRFEWPGYRVLETPPGPGAIALISACFFALSLGCYLARGLPSDVHFPGVLSALRGKEVEPIVIWMLFAVGAAAFIYVYGQSGLVLAIFSTPDEVLQMRESLHVRHFSHLLLLMDVTCIFFALLFFRSGSAIYVFPLVLTYIFYSLTFQKSRMAFVVGVFVFVALINYKRAIPLLGGSVLRVASTLGVVALMFVTAYAGNFIRGVGDTRPTSVSAVEALISPGPAPGPMAVQPESADERPSFSGMTDIEPNILEQAYLYSGALALRNLSATMEGKIKSDAPTYGLIVGRALFWPFVEDRNTLSPTQYLGGLNSGSALMYFWHDFGFVGAVLLSFVVGFAAMVLFNLAAKGEALGTAWGSLAFIACALSISTDAFFDPLTVILAVIALVVVGCSRLWGLFARRITA